MNPLATVGDSGLIPESGRSPGGGNDNPLQYSCLDNPKGRGAWRATVQGVTKSQTCPFHISKALDQAQVNRSGQHTCGRLRRGGLTQMLLPPLLSHQMVSFPAHPDPQPQPTSNQIQRSRDLWLESHLKIL